MRTRTTRLGIVALAAIGLGAGALTACQPVVLRLVVDSAADAVDAVPGDGVCATASGDCTLRAAVGEANATPGLDEITIAPGIDPVLSVAGQGDDGNLSGDLDSTGDLVIIGQGATVDGAGLDRVLEGVSGTLSVEDLTVTGGVHPLATGGAGGIHARGELRLVRTTVTGNEGGVSSSGAVLRISESVVAGNTSGVIFASFAGVSATDADVSIFRTTVDEPGTAVSVSGSSELVVLDSTVRAGRDGVVVQYGATAQVLRSTVQTTGGSWGSFAIDAYPATAMTVTASVIDAPAAEPAHEVCSSEITSEGHNVVSDQSCGLTGPGDLQGVEPQLGQLTDNGGPTPTMLPHEGSPVIDRVPAGSVWCELFLPTDQRGAPRLDGPACDAGSVEGEGGAVAPVTLVVDSSADGVDATPGDGLCATAGGACTLRAAVMEANATNSHLPNLADTVNMGEGNHPVLDLAGSDEDGARTGDLDVTGALTLLGNGATLDGAGLDRVLDATAPITIERLTITGGQVDGDGGGLRSIQGVVTLQDVTFADNHATGAGGSIHAVRLDADGLVVTGSTAGTDGGGIAVSLGAIETATISGNVAGGTGGGIMTDTSTLLRGSTIHGNTADRGGGLGAWEGYGTYEVVNSTITGNHAGDASAVLATGFMEPGLVLIGSTVADNTGGPGIRPHGIVCTRSCIEWDAASATGSILAGAPGFPACASPLASPAGNLLPDGSCGTGLPGTGALGPLADNGGPTLTRAPLAGSGAIDALPPGTPGACDGTLPVDQRGVARPTGPACDAGAVEQ